MKYMALLKNQENVHQEALPKLSEPPFDSNGSEGKRHVSEKQEPEPMDFDAETSAVLHELGAAGITVPDAPLEIRRECRALEGEITRAVHAEDVVRFRAALSAWRLAWMRSLH